MTTANKKSNLPLNQEVCIDLPGEPVRCWRSGDSITVILRKHRDVIFDLNLGGGRTYTVEATVSDFYNARDKKLVYAKRKQAVTFRDGERMHLWITRGFKGELLLKSEGALLMRIEPNSLDGSSYNDDPKTKPAPIIVALGKNGTSFQGGSTSNSGGSSSGGVQSSKKNEQPLKIVTPPASSAPVDEDCALVCVMDAAIHGAPEPILRHFKKGGGQSGLVDIDPFDVATRNWIWGQVAGSLAYIGDNWSWLRASMDSKTSKGFKLVSAKMHWVRGKIRFYFSGFSKYNTVFGRGGFGPGHERILSVFAGAGKTSSTFTAAWKGIIGSFKGYAVVSFIFGSATAIAEWADDVKKDGYDLAAGLLMSVLKTIIVAALVTAIVALIAVGLMVFIGVSLPVIFVGAIALGGGVLANYGIEALDKKLGKVASGDESNTDGLASVIAPYLRKAGAAARDSWTYLMEKFPNDYKEWVF